MKTKDDEVVTTTGYPVESTASSKGFEEPAPLFIHMANIVVPLDFSEMSLKALRYAVQFAKQFNAKLALVYVVELMAYTPELPYPPALPP